MPGFMIAQASGGGVTGISMNSPSATVEAMRAYRWRMTELTPPQSAGQPIRQMQKDVVPVELTLPSKSFEQLEISGLSHKYKFAKSVSFDDVAITLYDISGLQKKFEDWADAIWTKEKGLQTDYKGTAEFEMLDGKGEPLVLFKLNNVWPKKISHSQLSMSTNDFKLLTVTLAYDWYDLTIVKTEE